MTIITLEDKRVTLHDGKVGTEEECRCNCFELRLTPSPSIIGFDATLWNNCGSLVWDATKAKFEAAGWDVTIATRTGEDGFIYPTMRVSCSCCADCFALADAVAAIGEGGELADQPAGAWVEVQTRGGMAELGGDPEYIEIIAQDCGILNVFGEVVFGDGCCESFEAVRVPGSVNGVGYGTGFEGSSFIPACGPESPFCNPLP